MPVREWVFDAVGIPDICSQAQRQLAEWQARGGFVDFWFRSTARAVGDGDQVRVVLAYDGAVGLLSFDAWVRDRRVYGADDFVG